MATKTTIQMAREAAGDDWKLFQEYMPEIHKLAELVRADERAQCVWHGLTDEEIDDIDYANWSEDYQRWNIKRFARSIEAKLRSKNERD